MSMEIKTQPRSITKSEFENLIATDSFEILIAVPAGNVRREGTQVLRGRDEITEFLENSPDVPLSWWTENSTKFTVDEDGDVFCYITNPSSKRAGRLAFYHEEL